MKIMGMAGAAAAIPWRFDPKQGLNWAQAHAFMVSPGLTMFTEALRGVTGATGIPVAASDGAAEVTGATHYTMNIGEFTDQLHATFGAGSTRLWGFHPNNVLVGSATPRHLGGIILARRGTPIQITFRNNLTANGLPTGTALQSIIPVDTSIPGAGVNVAQNRTAVHVHGGHVPWISDGGPFDWWTPAGAHGTSFLNNQVLRSTTPALNEAEYYYPIDQSARLLWYHDHALGITRTNAYAGIATALIVRDAFEDYLITQGLPAPIEGGGFELPIVIQDKVFVNAASIATLDPTWATVARTGPTGVQTTGSLWYAHVYDPKLYKLSGNKKLGLAQNPSVVPEFFGDTMLANGTVYPTVTVQPRRYRFRILNACNARFLNLQLFQADASLDGITLAAKTLLPANLPYTVDASNRSGLTAGSSNCWVIGNEGGFLTAPVQVPLNVAFNPVTLGGSLIMGPAERLDVVIDFSGQGGKSFILYNDAPAPFPIGSPLNDFLPNLLGTGPNTREIMKFVVSGAAGTTADTTTMTLPADFTTVPLATTTDPWNDTLLAPYLATGFPDETGLVGAPIRKLTLNEAFDAFGRLIQLLGTNVPVAKGVFGRAYLDAATETPLSGTTEIWEIANLTGDTHPIHFHLVNVQVLSRQAFAVNKYGGTPTFVGVPRPPDLDERGWKETVKMHPGDVTRVVMKFTLPTVPFTVPASPRTGGNEYVWHCHILEHEEHDMMRPIVVT
jgi:spore coat protein A